MQGSVVVSAAGGTPRLDQVLDPTADKDFALANHHLGFLGGTVYFTLDQRSTDQVILFNNTLNSSSVALSADALGGSINFVGDTSGSARLGVSAVAGGSNEIFLPTATGTPGQVLSTDGGNPQQTSWVSRALVPLTGTTGTVSGALTAGVCDSGTATVTGATVGMVAVANPVTYPGDGATWVAYVSAADTVTVKECGLSVITPTATAYNVRVIQ